MTPFVASRDRRGFTLVEAAIAIVLLAGLILAIGRIVSTVSDTGRAELARASVYREVTLAIDTLDTDFTSARPCDTARFGSPFESFEPTRVALYSDATGDGDVDLIVWQITGNVMQRAVVAGDGSCDFPTADDDTALAYQSVLDGTQPSETDDEGTAASFVGWKDGTSTLRTSNWGSCKSVEPDQWNRCAFDRVEMHVRADRDDVGVITIDRAWPMEDRWTTL